MTKKTLLACRLILPCILLLGLNACRKNGGDEEILDLDDQGGGTLDGGGLGPGSEFESGELPGREGFGTTPVAGANYAPVYFGYDSSSVAPSEMNKVQQIADELINNPNYDLIIQGHTDERGSREYNVALGERRALAVREVLISFGVDGTRIQTLSFGEEQPAIAGFDESAFSMNRRAEFQLMQ